MTSHDSERSEIAELSSVELDAVTGGFLFGGGNPFQGVVTFFQNLFAPVINGVKGHVAGPMLAKKMYGQQASRAEKASGRRVMTDYFNGRFDPPARKRA